MLQGRVSALRIALREELRRALHNIDARAVQLVDNVLGGYADGTDKELGAALNDNVYKLIKLALGIVVLYTCQSVTVLCGGLKHIRLSCVHYLRLAGIAGRRRTARSCLQGVP